DCSAVGRNPAMGSGSCSQSAANSRSKHGIAGRLQMARRLHLELRRLSDGDKSGSPSDRPQFQRPNSARRDGRDNRIVTMLKESMRGSAGSKRDVRSKIETASYAGSL